MRTINSVGSADQGMMSGESKRHTERFIVFYLILSYHCGDRGPGNSAAKARDARSLARSLAHHTHPTMTPNGTVKIPTKVPLPTQQITHSLFLPFSFSSIKKILYNAIIPARTVLFWCATVSLPPTLGSSSWSHRDAGTTQTTHHRHRTSMIH